MRRSAPKQTGRTVNIEKSTRKVRIMALFIEEWCSANVVLYSFLKRNREATLKAAALERHLELDRFGQTNGAIEAGEFDVFIGLRKRLVPAVPRGLR